MGERGACSDSAVGFVCKSRAATRPWRGWSDIRGSDRCAWAFRCLVPSAAAFLTSSNHVRRTGTIHFPCPLRPLSVTYCEQIMPEKVAIVGGQGQVRNDRSSISPELHMRDMLFMVAHDPPRLIRSPGQEQDFHMFKYGSASERLLIGKRHSISNSPIGQSGHSYFPSRFFGTRSICEIRTTSLSKLYMLQS